MRREPCRIGLSANERKETMSNDNKLEIHDLVKISNTAPYGYPVGYTGTITDFYERGTRVEVASESCHWVIDVEHVEKIVF